MLRWHKRPGAAMIAAVIVVFGAAACGSTQATTTGSTESVTTTSTSSAPDRTVLESGGFALMSKSSYSCSAEAPADWTMTANPQSNSADLNSTDGSMYAGYGIQAVNTALAPYAGAEPPPLNDPDLYSPDPATTVKAYAQIVLAGLGSSGNLAYTNEYNQTIGDYTLRSVSSATHRGVIFFLTRGFPGDGVNYAYAEPFYIALSTSDRWPSEGLLVAQIAASIRCTTQLQPRDQYMVTPSESDTSGVDENGADPGYNPQLGTEYAHDSLGNNYLVSPSENWSEAGPDGGGYYINTSGGNDYERLQPGRSD